MSSTLHIIGAGLAGLSAGLAASGKGVRVVVYESSPHAGGRCRSYVDPKLNMMIDNGNHLLMGVNRHALRYLQEIGTLEHCVTRQPAAYQFVDIHSRKIWNIRPPRKFPGVPWHDWLRLFRLYNPAAHKVVTDCISPHSALYQRLIEPLTLAALNTRPEEASAAQLWEIIRRLLSGGEAAWRYYIPRDNLSATLVTPAVARVKNQGGTFYFKNPVQGLEKDGDRITGLLFPGGKQTVREGDRVICATSAPAMESLLPDLAPNFTYSSILNAHFRWPHAGTMREITPLVGIMGGLAQWLFLHPDRISTTTSAADACIEEDDTSLAHELWGDVQQALFMQKTALPSYRIIKEKRATLAATPENLTKRPRIATAYSNLFLAGDYIKSPYPATIEASVASGVRAAEKALAFVSPPA